MLDTEWSKVKQQSVNLPCRLATVVLYIYIYIYIDRNEEERYWKNCWSVISENGKNASTQTRTEILQFTRLFALLLSYWGIGLTHEPEDILTISLQLRVRHTDVTSAFFPFLLTTLHQFFQYLFIHSSFQSIYLFFGCPSLGVRPSWSHRGSGKRWGRTCVADLKLKRDG